MLFLEDFAEALPDFLANLPLESLGCLLGWNLDMVSQDLLCVSFAWLSRATPKSKLRSSRIGCGSEVSLAA